MTTPTTGQDGSVHVVGFDLGHGETAVATLWADSGDGPHAVRLHNGVRGVHPTAVAVTVNPATGAHHVLIGEACFSVHPKDVVEVYLAFKRSDLGDGSRGTTRRAIELFVGQVIRDLTGQSATEGSDRPAGAPVVPLRRPVRWVFGIPSGWRGESDAYAALLADVVREVAPGQGVDVDVEVVPESRAALLYSRRSGDLPESDRQAVAAHAGKGTALVIDMGSSTTDYTLVSGLHERSINDDGQPRLGAALIEQELMRRIVAAHPSRDRLTDALKKNPYSTAKLEFDCRGVKERFFDLSPSDPRLSADTAIRVLTEVVSPAGESIVVTLDVSAALVDEVLDTPLDELAGRSWRETFRAVLADLRARFDQAPDVVLMTGGASRMRFAQQLCQEIFGRDRVVLGPEPEFSIAKGLAIAGQTRTRANGFRADVRDFIADKLPGIVRSELGSLTSGLGTATTQGMVDDQLCPAVVKWRNGDLELLSDIAVDMLRARTRFLQSPPGRSRLDAVTEAWQSSVLLLVDDETRSICKLWDIAPEELQLSVARPGGSLNAKVDAKPALDVLDLIATSVASAIAAAVTALGMLVVGYALAPAGVVIVSNPAGWVFGTVLVVAGTIGGLLYGKEWAMTKAATLRVPKPMRKIGTADYLVRKVRKKAQEDEVERHAAEDFAKSIEQSHSEKIVTAVTAAVAAQLEQLALDVELPITRAGRAR